MKLLDFHGEFSRANHNCKRCGWSGKGSDMKLGEVFGDGADYNCPKCDERWGFAQFSVIVADNPPPDWKAKIARVEF